METELSKTDRGREIMERTHDRMDVKIAFVSRRRQRPERPRPVIQAMGRSQRMMSRNWSTDRRSPGRMPATLLSLEEVLTCIQGESKRRKRPILKRHSWHLASVSPRKGGMTPKIPMWGRSLEDAREGERSQWILTRMPCQTPSPQLCSRHK